MMNMRVSFGLLAAGAAFLTLQCGSFPDTCRGEECGPSGVDGSPEGGDTGGPDARKPPPDCDDQADVKDAPKCVVNSFGVFADSVGGADGNPGTKELPVQTVGAALRKLDGKARVYLCGGTYPEAVTLTSSISLYGGFTCPGGVWTHTGAKATLAPTLRGYALTVAKASLPMVVSDLELVAQAAMEPGESSVTAFLSESVAVTLRRVTANAGKGKDADNAGAPASNLFSETMADLDGFGAGAGAAGGGPKVCACKSYGTSTGGKGGNGGNPATGGDPGSATPAPAAMGGRDGAGGAGYPNGGAFACSSGKPGADGSARLGGKGAETLGTLDASGWTPGAGAPGEAGSPGGGAGGGGGGISNGSGGGGCGGCGGSGGLAAKGGGASIGILALTSAVRLEAVVINAADAGKGGAGGIGQAGGGGGGGAVGACGGGQGGNGAGGSGGGGGAGGVSAGVVRRGGSLDGTPAVTRGKKGDGGGAGGLGGGGTNALGTAAGGNPGAAGRVGDAQDVVVAE